MRVFSKSVINTVCPNKTYKIKKAFWKPGKGNKLSKLSPLHSKENQILQ